MGTGSSKRTAAISMADTGLNLDNNNNPGEKDIATEDQKPSVVPTSLLTSFSEKYPEITSTLSATNDYCNALKEARHVGKLISPTSLEHVKGLYNVYVQDKSPANRAALTEFAVALGIPKLAHEVVCRTNYQELTTCDREKLVEDEGEVNGMTESVDNLQVAFSCIM